MNDPETIDYDSFFQGWLELIILFQLFSLDDHNLDYLIIRFLNLNQLIQKIIIYKIISN